MIHVLYVDDEPDLLDLGKLFLERDGGIRVDTAPSAQAALSMMEMCQYDAIVSDYQMPDIDGIAFLKQVRSSMGNVAFILFTGKGRKEIVMEALNNGADFYVQKSSDPISKFTELQHKIRLAVDSRMAETELIQKNKKITLLYNISRHEIANHLMVLREKLKMTRKMSKDPALLPCISKIEEAAKEIYNNLEIARRYQEIGINEQKWFMLNNILKQVVERAEAAGIRCSVEVNSLEILADPLFPLVFSNLLDNTLRHGSHVTSLVVSCHRTARGMMVIWEDDGGGIPTEEKERIFNEGYGKNTGLGLFLCREILAITGITLQETGIMGRGARFEILVPEGKFHSRGGPWLSSAGVKQRSELQF